MEKCRLDPAHYYTAPGLSWDALLKKTGVELELLTDLDMHLFMKKGMLGGILITTQPSQTDKSHTWMQVTCLPLPKGSFKWKRVMPTQQQIIKLKETPG